MTRILKKNLTEFNGFRRDLIIDAVTNDAMIVTEQDASSILESIKAMVGDGFDASRDFQLLARIPLNHLTEWQAKEGLDTDDDSKESAKLIQKLVERDIPYLKVAKGDFK